jgi:energy-coupling factor transport system ATP-binding protein
VGGRVRAALEKVDLRKPLSASPHALSFGEKRRLAIACVLAMDPSVVVLDEPTTGLDYARCLSLFETLRKLNEEGRTVIVITHDTDLLARFAERVVVLEAGAVVRDGPSREVLSDVEFLRGHGFTPTQLQILASRLGAPAPTPSAVAESLARAWARRAR